MAQTYSANDDVSSESLGSLTSAQAVPAGFPAPAENDAPHPSARHPSRPNSPLLSDTTPYYIPYASNKVNQHASVPPQPRSHPADGLATLRRTLTPDLTHNPSTNPITYGNTLKVVQWTPQRGEEGTQVTIILDSAAINYAEGNLLSPSEANFGPIASDAPPHARVNRKFLVEFGRAPAATEFTRAQAIDGNGVGESMNAGPNESDAFVVLTTFAPSRTLMGPTNEPVLVTVSVVDDENTTRESTIIGTWDQGVVAVPSRHNLKRSGEELVSHREGPGIESPIGAHSQTGSPVRPSGEWNAQHAIPAIRTSSAEVDTSIPASSGVHPPASTHDLLNGQPELVRTSQIQASKQGSGASYSHKVVLKLQGDLNTMAMGWSNEEWQNRRRLIQFWPQQEGNIVNVAFRPVPQNEWQPNSITVSCIFRDDWNECFVTSVDTIYLLEALVGSRFSVEEKNRIRRNLEGFKPLTVSKSKPDAEPFFKLIMGFPQPKPRNIEKDVKVFPWKILSNALKKIMSKYSASYPINDDAAGSSGAAPSPSPAGSSGVNTSASASANTNGHLAAPVSPRPSKSPSVASPQVANGSPRVPQSPSVMHSASAGHFSHASTPHMSPSPRVPSSAFVPPSPQLHSVPHSPVMSPSPQRLNAYNNPRLAYEVPATYDSREYAVPQHNLYSAVPSTSAAVGGAAAGGTGPAPGGSQLFPSAEDYGVNSHHLAPPSATHYRSYSEGLPRTAQDSHSAIYSTGTYPGYDAPSHPANNYYSHTASQQPDWATGQTQEETRGGGAAISGEGLVTSEPPVSGVGVAIGDRAESARS
ncbi:uncharacterized protein JCM15063_002748 [Sporobolomyces koalae]|uniref:uncharacterized protein n=1 Tax=Sporobolomyces koalae TaxID=500713 RepID=UPI0031811EC9